MSQITTWISSSVSPPGCSCRRACSGRKHTCAAVAAREGKATAKPHKDATADFRQSLTAFRIGRTIRVVRSVRACAHVHSRSAAAMGSGWNSSAHWHTYLIEEELVQQVPRRLLGVKALLVGFDHFRDRHIALRHDALHSMSASADQRKKHLLLSKPSKWSRGSPHAYGRC
jgi:hypothetical protein